LLTLVGAAALGVAAFASPAAAQTPEPVVADVLVDEPVTIGGDFASGAIHLEFGDDFTPGEVDVTAQLSVYGNGIELAGGHTEHGDCELGGTPPQWVNCLASEADAEIDFKFDYRALDTAEPGEYEYALLIGVDGENLDPINGTIQVGDEGGEDSPFLYGKAQFEMEPGSTHDTAPGFLQTGALPEGTVALAYGVSEPSYILSGLAEASAPYENCVDGFWTGDGGITCIVTDIQDAPGTTFAPDAPISFSVGETVPGPVELCGCSFAVRALDAETLEAEYGDVNTGSGDQLGLAVVSEGDDPAHFDSIGYIDIRTTENPFDLAVSDANAKGDKGNEVTLTVPVKNLGPADAASFFDGPGSYGIIGSLPKGLELVKIDSDGDDLSCFEPDDPTVEHSFPQVDPAKTDFVCLFWSLGADESFDFEFTVKITDANATAKGTLEVAAIDHDGYPGVADADAKNNIADITVNGTGSGSGTGKLPKTGTSLTLVVGIAALVLVAGAVMLIVTARKRRA
jgi:LPXTG-motif cell wall-anchored protein